MTTIITGTLLSDTGSSSDRMCRISGILHDTSGRPLKGYGLTVRNRYDPIAVVGGALVLQERKVYRTDKDGFLEFELLRGSRVDVELPNRLSDHVLHRSVPDVPRCALIDFLFPYLASFEFDPSTPPELEVGEILALAVHAVLSNGDRLAVGPIAASLASSNPTVLERKADFFFSALAVGTAQISMTLFEPAQLQILQEPNGEPTHLLSIPVPPFPTPLLVTVT